MKEKVGILNKKEEIVLIFLVKNCIFEIWDTFEYDYDLILFCSKSDYILNSFTPPLDWYQIITTRIYEYYNSKPVSLLSITMPYSHFAVVDVFYCDLSFNDIFPASICNLWLSFYHAHQVSDFWPNSPVELIVDKFCFYSCQTLLELAFS